MAINKRFALKIDGFEDQLAKLRACPRCEPLKLARDMPLSGIYVLYEGRRPLCVGRSNRLRKRIGNHCRAGASHRMAAFAFRLAREETGRQKAAYTREGSRTVMMTDPKFRKAFERAKERIRNMRVRYVEETDPTRQALLEIYIAVALQAPYNDFNTH